MDEGRWKMGVRLICIFVHLPSEAVVHRPSVPYALHSIHYILEPGTWNH